MRAAMAESLKSVPPELRAGAEAELRKMMAGALRMVGPCRGRV